MTKKEKLPMIDVTTHPNGYSLRFDGMSKSQGFLYFKPDKLLEGFMLHIGIEMTDQLNTETMQDFIVTATKWNENKANVKEIARLNKALKALKIRRNALAGLLIRERSKHLSLIEEVELLAKRLKDYPDKDIRERLNKILKFRKGLGPLTMHTLGINGTDAPTDEEV